MSNKIEHHPLVYAYLQRVRAQVKAKELHDDIRFEMLNHLEERVDEKIEQGGKTEEEAIEEALRQMGDPDLVGKQLHAVHKPKLEWSVFALVAVMIVIGLVSLVSLKFSLNLLVGRKLFFGFVGVAAMIVLYFVDYRRMLGYSKILYGMTLLLMAIAKLQGTQGPDQWIGIGSFGIHVYAMSPYLLIIAIAGMLQKEKLEVKSISQKALLVLAKDAAIYMLIPTIFYLMAPAFTYLVIYSLSLAMLLLVAGKRKLLLTGIGILALLLSRLIHSQSFYYTWQRFTAFFPPVTDRKGFGFLTMRSVEAIHSGGMWGQGVGVVNSKLPYVSSEMIYSYLVYSLGWVFGITLAVITLLFIVRVTRMGFKLQNDYAKSLVVGLSLVFGIQYVWNLLMSIGLLPILGGMSLPIINWTSVTMIELGAVGLMLSAYRRKDIIVSSYRHQITKV
ncbi:cell division protein FtsW [Paenibacillus baekrokdamisoli]|uniref:Cell division protein FtsW n=1 Tax=Paenibacillus baekrokdamisoli TaxID=1712516 RepID=A0A3G9IVA3_9BACL|nr:FtsW/RodA/SpoVE family cell cycle protein [Paenibacillus baekrokdamisoli]MBB3070675.1 cell division protein FtsW (lipid II flippase) [Paenibacillus baekrokdamisoli]BBH20025.1 cell division protein FtsW [Paenibacillus baekrokdamisoli]